MDRSATSMLSALEQPRIRLTAILVVSLVVGALFWSLVGDEETSSTTAADGGGTGEPIGLSSAELRSTAEALGQPVYWAGPRPGFTYEYNETADGRIFVRYLPPGVDVGDSRADFTVVATYPFPNALAALREVSGGQTIALPGGGVAAVDGTYPKSVHLAFPGVEYQVEVYDPSPRRARAVATSGAVAPVK